MNLEGLKLFKEVAAQGSISRVAGSSHFSQPAISQQIKRLEEALGCELFTRSNKGVELTEAGKIVNRYARSIIKSYENMLEDLTMVEDTFDLIRMNCTPIVSTYAMPCTVYTINNKVQNPAPLKLELYTSHSDEVETNIINDVFDIGIIISQPRSSDLATALLASDSVVPVVGASYGANEVLTAGDLARMELILPGSRFRMRALLNDWFSQGGHSLASLNVISEADEIESIKSAVVRGYGVSFLPYLTIKKELYTRQLKRLQVDNFDLSYEIVLIYKDSRLADQYFRDFVQMFRKTARKTFC